MKRVELAIVALGCPPPQLHSRHALLLPPISVGGREGGNSHPAHTVPSLRRSAVASAVSA